MGKESSKRKKLMKIKRIKALPLRATMKPLCIATTTFTDCRALIVCITTDDGFAGIGESLVRSAPRESKCNGTIQDHMIFSAIGLGRVYVPA